MQLKIVLRKIEDDLFLASCANFEGCHVEAASEEEARELIKIAINAYIISHKQRHEKLPIKQI